MTTEQKRSALAVSFVMAFVQIACLALFTSGIVRAGTISFRHLVQFWVACAIAGMACAAIVCGDPAKRPLNSIPFLGLALNGGFLVILGILYVVSFVHD